MIQHNTITEETTVDPIARHLVGTSFCQEFLKGNDRCRYFQECQDCIHDYLQEYYGTLAEKGMLQHTEMRNLPSQAPGRAKENTSCTGCARDHQELDPYGKKPYRHVAGDKGHFDTDCLHCRRHRYWEKSWAWKQDLYEKAENGKAAGA